MLPKFFRRGVVTRFLHYSFGRDSNFRLIEKNWSRRFGQLRDFGNSCEWMLGSNCSPRLNKILSREIRRMYSSSGDGEDNENSQQKIFRPDDNMFPNILVTIAIFMLYSMLQRKWSRPKLEMTVDELFKKYFCRGRVLRFEYDERNHVVHVHLTKEAMASLNSTHRKGKKAVQFRVIVKALNKKTFERRLRKEEVTMGIDISEATEIHPIGIFSVESIARKVLSATLFLGILILINRRSRGMMMSGGNDQMNEILNFSKMQIGDTLREINTRFSDIAGMKEAKLEVSEFIDYFENFDHYRSVGARIPRGAILFGPPGTGKTLLAKALAGESGVPFYSVSGSDFVEVYVGVGAARVRDLFERARGEEQAIIFIDEIDAIGRPRGLNPMYGGGSDERQNTLNQLLLELDGFGDNDNVIVFGSTNVSPEGLDGALLRAGRFDRSIYVDVPTKGERKEIFEYYLGKMEVEWDSVGEEEMDGYAAVTAGQGSMLSRSITGADIEAICNEAGIVCVREGGEAVNTNHISEAIERVLYGLEGTEGEQVSIEEKRELAIHLIGHVMGCSLLENGNDFVSVSIKKRGGQMGNIFYVVDDEKRLMQVQGVEDRICELLCGRVAEMEFGEREKEDVTISGCTLNDLRNVTVLGYTAVMNWGMIEEKEIIDEDVKKYFEGVVGGIGNLVSRDIPGSELETIRKSYGEQTAKYYDLQVKALLQLQANRAKEILLTEENEKIFHKLVEELLNRKTLSKEEVEEIFQQMS